MIKVFEAEANKSFTYQGKNFSDGEKYKVYMNHGGYIVYNDGEGILFIFHIPGHFRNDECREFYQDFEILKEHHVRNKKELKNFLKH